MAASVRNATRSRIICPFMTKTSVGKFTRNGIHKQEVLSCSKISLQSKILTISKRNFGSNRTPSCSSGNGTQTFSKRLPLGPQSVSYGMPYVNRSTISLSRQCQPLLSLLISRNIRLKSEQGSSNTANQYEMEANTGWLIRLANENGYLSWVRNAYLSTMIGCTMYSQNVLEVPYSQEAGVLFFVLACANMLAATGIYTHNTLFWRNKMLMSRVYATFNVSMAGLHLMVWVIALSIYLGYVEDEDDDDDMDGRKKKTKIKGGQNLKEI